MLTVNCVLLHRHVQCGNFYVELFFSMLVNVPGISLCIFSTGQRASSALMREIKRLLSKVPNGAQRIVRQTEELLFVSPTPRDPSLGVNSASTRDLANNSDVSKLYSFPAGTHVRFCDRNLLCSVLFSSSFDVCVEVEVDLGQVSGISIVRSFCCYCGCSDPDPDSPWSGELLLLHHPQMILFLLI